MDALKAIATRRSVRKYKKDDVPRPLVARMIEALFASPSAVDARPWHFIVIDDREILRQLGREMADCEMLFEAPLGILICADPSLERAPGFWPQDCAAAAENLLLAAHALGLGAVWVGLYPMEERVEAVRRVMAAPRSVIPFALVAIGCPAEQPPPENRFDPAKLHHNRWGQHGGFSPEDDS
jgi:nitroreductase